MGKSLAELFKEKMEQERGRLPAVDMAVGGIKIHLRITVGPNEDDLVIENDDIPELVKELQKKLKRIENMITCLALKAAKTDDCIFELRKAAKAPAGRRITGWFRRGKR